MDVETLRSVLISAGLIVGLAVLVLALVQVLAGRAMRAVQAMKPLREGRRQQLITFIHVVQWGATILVLASALLTLLSTFGVDITPLLASAGLTGLAISLGAQSLIKDFIGGILILVENQYAVGDTIEVGSVVGEVERISLRTTCVRDINGYLFVVPHGEVRIVANQSRGWSRALVDVGVAYEADLDRALRVLEETSEDFAKDATFGPQLLEAPKVLGPQSLGNSAITVRVMVKTQVGKHVEVARELRKHVLFSCEREGIELPYPRQEVLVRSVE
jgi:small conductance mechanosensitive channel